MVLISISLAVGVCALLFISSHYFKKRANKVVDKADEYL